MSSVNSFREYSRGDVSIYKGVSDRPLGWKPRKSVQATVGKAARDANLMKWDGAARSCTQWDGLRRDPELWTPNGDCYVHLYAPGSSRRGPAFRLYLDTLMEAQCLPIIDRFLVATDDSPYSETSSKRDSYFSYINNRRCELFIPAPASAERGQAMLYHIATRNFFAWLEGKSLVGRHLGGALVGLLNSMGEFRLREVDNVADVLQYMDEEGYTDMTDRPDYALANLYFAEHFHFRDLWLDAFAHCAGMYERLNASPEFEHISRTTKSLIKRARLEMDARLGRCSDSMRNFLDVELSSANLGLPSPTRSELDRFRSFLQAYYVAKLGYYPPSSASMFPKDVFESMCRDFQYLFEYLVDDSGIEPAPAQGGICVLQILKAFDERHNYEPLENVYPLLPESDLEPVKKHRFSFTRPDKLKMDQRLVILNSMCKATNRQKTDLLESSFVRAYCGYEKQVIFSKVDKATLVSPEDARKIRWIMVYGMLQTLRAATKIPVQVRDAVNVPYNISVLTAGCPEWTGPADLPALLRTQTEQMELDWSQAEPKANELRIEPDVDYQKLNRLSTASVASRSSSRIRAPGATGTVRRALSTLGNMPELKHPKPIRNSHHEILVRGYGNGTHTVSITAGPTAALPRRAATASPSLKATQALALDIPAATTKREKHASHVSTGTSATLDSDNDFSSHWSQSSGNGSPSTRPSSFDSDSPITPFSADAPSNAKLSVRDILEKPFAAFSRRGSSKHSEEDWASVAALRPKPLALPVRRPTFENGGVLVTQETTVEFEQAAVNPEVDAYLQS